MAELVDAADSKSVFERSGSSSLPRGTKIRKKPTLWSVFFCLRLGAPTRSLWEIAQPFEPRCRTGSNVRERVTFPCGSGRVEASNRREADDAVYGTGSTGVLGGSTPRHARSHSVPANSISYVQFHESPPGAALTLSAQAFFMPSSSANRSRYPTGSCTRKFTANRAHRECVRDGLCNRAATRGQQQKHHVARIKSV